MNEDELTVQDIVDAADTPIKHTVLEMWLKILLPSRDERGSRITPQQATRLIGTYPGLTFKDLPRFQELFYDLVEEMLSLLETVIESDSEALNRTGEGEDAEENASLYHLLVVEWQKIILREELDWKPTDDDAAERLAAMAEVHRMFFDRTGLTALLDEIKFEFTDADRENLSEELDGVRAEASNGR